METKSEKDISGGPENVPEYSLSPETRKKLLRAGFVPHWANEQPGVVDAVIDGKTNLIAYCDAGWKQGMYMLAWDFQRRRWALFNFPICNN